MNSLNFRAGKTALGMIREGGLSPGMVKVVGAAAGGPKWLVMGHLDRAMFGSWFAERQTPLFLVGSSSGAWRLAAACMADPAAAVERFEDAYIHQYYLRPPTPETISREGRRILQHLLGSKGPQEILNHPFLRLNLMCVRCRGLAAIENFSAQALGFLIAAAINLFSRKGLKLFFERALFYDPRDQAPFFAMNEFPIQRIPLCVENIKTALTASGSIPMLMNGVHDIRGASRGVYRDGALIDYHMDLPYLETEGLYLLPHYAQRIVPGWLDKHLAWRGPSSAHLDRMLLVTPAPDFLEKLPLGKIPDRSDFEIFKGRDHERLAYWYKAVDLSRALADDFMEAVLSGSIRRRVEPM